MKRARNHAGVLLTLLAIVAAPGVAAETVLVKNAEIWTQGSGGRLAGADLLIRDGKIVDVGISLDAPRGAVEIDASGKHVTPGLIDCHSHTAIRGGVNEGSNNVTAEVRIEDVVNPDDINLYRQLAGGLTAAHLLHGSANSIGGQDAVIKLKWKTDTASLLIPDAHPGIKFALGENPKRSNFRVPGGTPRYPGTRMGVMESIRERFLAARDYMTKWESYRALSERDRARTEPPRTDLQLEAIAEILRGERRVHSHSYRQDEILALLRVAEEFGVTIGTFQHVLEGYKVADELAAHGAGASTFSDWWAYKLEAYDAIPFNGALMHARGVSVSFNSDSSELARRMNLEAAKAVKWGGVPPEEALSFVTRNAADQLGIGHRTGSLEKGKDADFVIWSGDPLSVYSIVEQTWVDGERQFDRAEDLAGRPAVEAERSELIAKVKSNRKSEKTEATEGEEDGEEDAGDDDEVSEDETAPQPPLPRLAYVDRLATSSPAVSLVNATVHTVSGAVLEDATVSFRDGRIVAVGSGLAPLQGAQRIDVKGKHVYPGMIAANSAIGLTEIGSVAGSVDLSEVGEINPNAHTEIAVNPDSELIPVTRANGLTHAVAAPSGGLVSGQSTLIRLDGWTWEDLRAASPAGLHVRWPSFGGGRRFGGGSQISDADRKKSREADIKKITRLFDDARAYAKAKTAGEIEIVPPLESMLPVLDGDVPVILHAGEIRQLRSALTWAEEQGLSIVLSGSGDIWRVAELLAERRIPVILTRVLALPSREDEPYDIRFTEAAKLHDAGVTFCIAMPGFGFAAPMARTLPYQAAMAAAFGLPKEVALRSVTLDAARVLGVEGDLGSIEVGKSASLIVTDGDPLEITTTVERVFIDGREVDPRDNKHDRLYRRYQGRPAVGAR